MSNDQDDRSGHDRFAARSLSGEGCSHAGGETFVSARLRAGGGITGTFSCSLCRSSFERDFRSIREAFGIFTVELLDGREISCPAEVTPVVARESGNGKTKAKSRGVDVVNPRPRSRPLTSRD